MKKRWKRKISFIVVFLCLLMLKSVGQTKLLEHNKILPEKFDWKNQVLGRQDMKQIWPVQAAQLPYNTLTQAISSVSHVQALSAKYYVNHLGYICDKEW